MGTLRLGSSVVVPSVTVNSGPAQPVIDPLSITPTTSQQTITAPSGVDGYSPITVNAVTSSIDANITAGNIKKDVSILGVTGTYEGSGGTLITKTITENGVYNASSDNADGYSTVTVNVSSGRKLPAGYTELEYITTVGDVYIDTGIKLANTDIVEAEFKNNDGTSASYGALYGIYALGESSAFYANVTYYGYDVANDKVNTNIVVDGNWHKVVHDFVNGTLTIDNTVTAFTPFTFTNVVNCGLCARYSSSYGYFWRGSIKRFTVSRGSSVICDLIPAIRKSDNAIGMYDIVRNQFFNKSGSGSFSAGPEINCGYVELPSYAIDENGVASKQAKVLNGTEFAGITSIATQGMDAVFYFGMLRGPVVFSDLVTIGNYGLRKAFSYCYLIEGTALGITQALFPSLQIIGNNGLEEAFYGSEALRVIDLSAVVTINYEGLLNAFNACPVVTVDLSSVTSIGNRGMQYCFSGDRALNSVDLSSVNTLNTEALAYAFQNTTLPTISFPSLSSTSFGTWTDQFNGMLRGVTGCIVHFPSNLQSVIGSWSSVQNGFGGTNTTVLFDLPATE